MRIKSTEIFHQTISSTAKCHCDNIKSAFSLSYSNHFAIYMNNPNRFNIFENEKTKSYQIHIQEY